MNLIFKVIVCFTALFNSRNEVVTPMEGDIKVTTIKTKNINKSNKRKRGKGSKRGKNKKKKNRRRLIRRKEEFRDVRFGFVVDDGVDAGDVSAV